MVTSSIPGGMLRAWSSSEFHSCWVHGFNGNPIPGWQHLMTLSHLLTYILSALSSTMFFVLPKGRGCANLPLKARCLLLNQKQVTEIMLELRCKPPAGGLVFMEAGSSMQTDEKRQLWSHPVVDHACYNVNLHSKILSMAQLWREQQLLLDGIWGLLPGGNTHLAL